MKLAPALYLNVSEHLNITSSIIHKSMESFHWPCKWMLTPNWLEWKCMAARDWSSTCWISYMGTCHLSALITANIFRHLTVDFFFFYFIFYILFDFISFFFFFGCCFVYWTGVRVSAWEMFQFAASFRCQDCFTTLSAHTLWNDGE